MLRLLNNNLPNKFPIDLIKLIKDYTCDCEQHFCNFCDLSFSHCHLTRCATCYSRSCEKKSCPKLDIKFIISYTYSHKEIKCSNSCPNCENDLASSEDYD